MCLSVGQESRSWRRCRRPSLAGHFVSGARSFEVCWLSLRRRWSTCAASVCAQNARPGPSALVCLMYLSLHAPNLLGSSRALMGVAPCLGSRVPHFELRCMHPHPHAPNLLGSSRVQTGLAPGLGPRASHLEMCWTYSHPPGPPQRKGTVAVQRQLLIVAAQNIFGVALAA